MATLSMLGRTTKNVIVSLSTQKHESAVRLAEMFEQETGESFYMADDSTYVPVPASYGDGIEKKELVTIMRAALRRGSLRPEDTQDLTAVHREQHDRRFTLEG